LMVPVESVLRSGREMFCYVKGDKGLEERPVKLGISNGSQAEVVEGLKEGELVLHSPRAVLRLLARPPAQGSRRPAQVRVRSVRLSSADKVRTRVETYGLTYKDLERIAALPGVAEVVPVRRFPAQARRLETRADTSEVIATVPGYKDFF